MIRRIACTLIACLAAIPAFAHDEEFEVLEHTVFKLAAGKAKITAKQAIEAAAKVAGGARLAEVAMGVKGETPVFEVVYLTDGGANEITIDAIRGNVLGSEDEKPDADEAKEYGETSKALGAAKFTLAQALDAALTEVKGGTAVEAEAYVEDGLLEFTVEVMSGDAFKKVEFTADGKLKEVEDEKPEGQAWIFDADAVGKPPAGWKSGFTNADNGKATWTVEKDAGAPTGPNLLALKAESGGGTFNLAIAERTSYADVDVRTRIRANAGKVDQGGGLIWRCKDENNYYVCRVNPLESNFRVYKVTEGKRQQLQSVELKTEIGKWYVVRAKMVGGHIQCYVDGKRLLDTTDDALTDAGMVGLWTKADASSSFDNIAVKPGKASKSDSASSAKPGDNGKKADDDDDDDDDHPTPQPKNP